MKHRAKEAKTASPKLPSPKVLKLASPKLQSVIAGALLLAAVCALGAYHVLQFSWVMGDENEHLYVARQVASGVSLYGGIHSARPPLIFVPLVALLRLGVSPLLAGRLCVFLTVVATALVLGWIGWRLWGLWSGLAGAVLFLLCPDVAGLFPFLGIHQTALFCLLCLALRLEGAPAWAGFAGGLALASGQHSAVIVAATALFQIWSKPKAALVFVSAALGVMALTVTACLAMGGSGIWEDLLGHHLFHLNAGRIEGQVAQTFSWDLGTWLSDNLGLLVLAGVGAVAGLRNPRVRFWLGVALLHVLVVVGMSFGFVMYLFPAVPLLAGLAGHGLAHSVGKLKLWSPSGGWRRPSLRPTVALLVYVLFTVGGLWLAATRSDERYRGRYSLWPHQRELEKTSVAGMHPADRVADVLSHTMSRGASIFGFSPPLISYLALQTNTRIAGQLADLSIAWLVDGTVSRSSVVSKLENDQIEFFVSEANSFYVRDPFFLAYLQRCYGEPYRMPRIEGNLMPTLYLFPHKDVHPCQ
jgi:hypothetical protein